MIFAHLIPAASDLLTDPSALESSISGLERAISALESDIRALESSSAAWEPWVWVFSFLVVIGVVAELWVIRHDWRDEMEMWAIWDFVGLTRSPSRPSRRKLLVEIASVLLIAIGVAGETAIGVKIASINGMLRGKATELRAKNAELRSESEQLLALVTQEAGDAKTSAEEAANAAHRVMWYATLLARAINPRTLDSKALVQKLAGKPKGTAEIWYEPEIGEEPEMFATQIYGALGSDGAGWKVSTPKSLPPWDKRVRETVWSQRTLLEQLRIEANSGLGLEMAASKTFPFDASGETVWGVLWTELTRASGGGFHGGGWIETDPTLPENHFVIVVGHHTVNVPLWVPTWQNARPVPLTKHKNSTK